MHKHDFYPNYFGHCFPIKHLWFSDSFPGISRHSIVLLIPNTDNTTFSSRSSLTTIVTATYSSLLDFKGGHWKLHPYKCNHFRLVHLCSSQHSTIDRKGLFATSLTDVQTNQYKSLALQEQTKRLLSQCIHGTFSDKNYWLDPLLCSLRQGEILLPVSDLLKAQAHVVSEGLSPRLATLQTG